MGMYYVDKAIALATNINQKNKHKHDNALNHKYKMLGTTNSEVIPEKVNNNKTYN